MSTRPAVLIAIASERTRQSIARLVTRYGGEPVEARSLNEASAATVSHDIAVVILALVENSRREVSKIRAWTKAPIYLVANSKEGALPQAALDAGASAVYLRHELSTELYDLIRQAIDVDAPDDGPRRHSAWLDGPPPGVDAYSLEEIEDPAHPAHAAAISLQGQTPAPAADSLDAGIDFTPTPTPAPADSDEPPIALDLEALEARPAAPAEPPPENPAALDDLELDLDLMLPSDEAEEPEPQPTPAPTVTANPVQTQAATPKPIAVATPAPAPDLSPLLPQDDCPYERTREGCDHVTQLRTELSRLREAIAASSEGEVQIQVLESFLVERLPGIVAETIATSSSSPLRGVAPMVRGLNEQYHLRLTRGVERRLQQARNELDGRIVDLTTALIDDIRAEFQLHVEATVKPVRAEVVQIGAALHQARARIGLLASAATVLSVAALALAGYVAWAQL